MQIWVIDIIEHGLHLKHLKEFNAYLYPFNVQHFGVCFNCLIQRIWSTF